MHRYFISTRDSFPWEEIINYNKIIKIQKKKDPSQTLCTSTTEKFATVKITIRDSIDQFPMVSENAGPRAAVEKPFLLSDGRVGLEARLDRAIYAHGDPISVHVNVNNSSSKTVRRIKVSVICDNRPRGGLAICQEIFFRSALLDFSIIKVEKEGEVICIRDYYRSRWYLNTGNQGKFEDEDFALFVWYMKVLYAYGIVIMKLSFGIKQLGKRSKGLYLNNYLEKLFKESCLFYYSLRVIEKKETIRKRRS